MKTPVCAEFDSAEAIIHAAERLRALGYGNMDAFTPFPIPELEAPLRLRRSTIPRFAGMAAVTGLMLAYGIIFYCNGISYPLDVGGRPLDSWPADIPIMFETAVLFTALTAFVLTLAFSGLPRLHHPVFEIDGFDRVSIDRYLLVVGDDAGVETRGEMALRDELRSLGAGALHEGVGDT